QDLSTGAHLDAGSADFPFTDVQFSGTNVNDCVTVNDTNPAGPQNQQICAGDASPKEFNYSADVNGDAGTCTDNKNTASFETNTSGTQGSDSTTVTDCQGADLTVSKTATPSYDLTYKWDTKKSADTDKVYSAGGDKSGAVNYTVDVSRDAGTQSNWKVSGKITVSNPNDWEDIVADVSDSLPGGTCSVTGGTDVNVPASGSASVDYSCAFASNPGTGTNTGTATWDAAAAHTPNGSASGDKAFDFANATVNSIDECVSVSDPADSTSPHNFCVGDADDPNFS